MKIDMGFNGLIRQYFPKGTDIRNVKREEIKFVQNRLNSRPRKPLDFRTPNEILLEAVSLAPKGLLYR